MLSIRAYADGTALELDELPGHIQTQAGSVLMRIGGLVETVEDELLLLRLDAAAGVGDSDDDVGAAVNRIAREGSAYRKGVLDFAAHYDFERYYAEGFRSYEEVWR